MTQEMSRSEISGESFYKIIQRNEYVPEKHHEFSALQVQDESNDDNLLLIASNLKGEAQFN